MTIHTHKNPLGEVEKVLQGETKNPYSNPLIVNTKASMPEITLEHKSAAGGITKSIDAVSPVKVYPPQLKDTFGMEENLRNQFISNK